MDEDQLNNAKVEEKDNPALSKVIERNIRTIIHLCTETVRQHSLLTEHEMTSYDNGVSTTKGDHYE